ncbi:MAG: alpha/beta hydrolase [Anaerolineae bacterium]|nr:alpha/beta hydrolase [Anaerolineae bacterium]
MWNPHRAAIAGRYRAVSYTQRYFGPAPWRPDWPPFGVNTHADDLAEFLQKLGIGPAHLVAWSYAGHVALTMALKQPDLLKSLFIYEPGVPTYVTDPAELEAFAADANAMFGPVFEAVQSRGDNVEGVRRLIDGSGQMPGYFDSQPQERQDLQMENARTMPLQLAQSAPPVITCEQLGTLTMPVCIAQGELTRPLFSIVSRAAARCIPHCRHMIIPGATHMWPDEDATGFITAVLDFLKDL